MNVMQSSRFLRVAMIVAALAASMFGSRAVLAQDRVVGREAVAPEDRENLPPSIDGRTDSDEDVDPRALEDFREPLAPHGAWIDDPNYGTIWVPDARVVGPDFTPYQTAGHWELTADADWLWVSDYAWGDIPFHYGRWVWVEGRGWGWVPGRVWAPAWVVWRTGPYGYVGWGPCPPTWGWYGGSAVWLWWPPPAPYWFVETRYVFVNHVHRHIIRQPARVATAARQTTPQRRPASPGSRSLDAHRPAHPDFDQLRYTGPTPTRTPARPHPEVGPDRRMNAGRANGLSSAAGRRELGRSDPRERVGARDSDRAPARRTGRGVAPSGRMDGPTPRRGDPRAVAPRPAGPRPEADADRRSTRPRTAPPTRESTPREPGRDLAPRSPGAGRSPSGPPTPAPPSIKRPTAPVPVPAPPPPPRAVRRGRR